MAGETGSGIGSGVGHRAREQETYEAEEERREKGEDMDSKILI